MEGVGPGGYSVREEERGRHPARKRSLKKNKHHKPAAISPDDLKARLDRARTEGKTQQALELAKQLHKAQPGPETLRLLGDAYLARAAQLRQAGFVRDAA